MMNILAISVHPDDETLGCGGTLLKHRSLGDNLYWLILTEVSAEYGYSKETINIENGQIDKVAEAYGFAKVFKSGWAPARLHTVDFSEMIAGISDVINEVRPDSVYIVNRSDVHTDHQIAARAIISSTKSFRNPFIKRILMYECISETEIAPALPENIFIPNVYSDISEYIEKKLDIMSIYRSEIQNPPLPRSIDNIKSLARYRGASIGVEYAEAFMIIREVF